MASSLLRGLTLLELVDQFGPLGVTELARRLGVDKAGISRVVSAAEKEGWVAREDGKVVLGPRAALLGLTGATNRLVRRAEPLVNTIAGVTGVHTQAKMLVGADSTAIAAAAGEGLALPVALRARVPIWTSGASKVIAAQLEKQAVEQLLPPDPLPDGREVMRQVVHDVGLGAYDPSAPASPTAVGNRAGLHRQLTRIRRDDVFHEIAEVASTTASVAVPWPQPGAAAALCCVGTVTEIAETVDRLTRVLQAAARPNATRDDVVAAAARRR